MEKVHITRQGSVGILQINSPKTLNALDTDIIQKLRAGLKQFAQDAEVCSVVLCGIGEKGFCAGGDVKKVVSYLQDPALKEQARVFFTEEYALDGEIGTYPKPIVTLGHGLVFGGGFGLFGPSSVRVITEATQMSMPEMMIGFFPDVGGTYFLARLPAEIFRFVCLTAYRFTAADLMHYGLAEVCVSNAVGGDPAAFVPILQGLNHRDEIVRAIAAAFLGPRDLGASRLAAFESRIQACWGGKELEQLYPLCREMQTQKEFEPLVFFLQQFLEGSPVSARATEEICRTTRGLSHMQVLERDFTVAMRFCEEPDFVAGVTQKLVEKRTRVEWPSALN